MALDIRDPHTERLSRELAELSGQPITVAVRVAIEERLERLRQRKGVVDGLGLAEVIARGRARRVVDPRSEDNLLGHGPEGLPVAAALEQS